MAKQTVPERVNEYIKKYPEAYNLLLEDVNEIRELGDILDIICTAFAYGYMKASKAKKGEKKTKHK